jgi:hypothetical protein
VIVSPTCSEKQLKPLTPHQVNVPDEDFTATDEVRTTTSLQCHSCIPHNKSVLASVTLKFYSNLFLICSESPSGKETTWKTRRRWEDNIKMDLQEVGWGAWTGLIWLRIGTVAGLL